MRAQEGPLKIADKIRSLKPRKIDEIYFFSVFRLVINKPNHRFLSLILGFAITVAVWPREFVSCRDFIYVLSLVGIYLIRASILPVAERKINMCPRSEA